MLLDSTEKARKQNSVAQSVHLLVRNDTQDFTNGKSSQPEFTVRLHRLHKKCL
jgi:hypothetical protein